MPDPQHPPHTEAAAKPGCMMAVLFGSIIGAMITGVLFVSGVHFTWSIKSGDFLTTVLAALGVMLAATSVMIAVVALALAVFGFYGYQKIKDILIDQADESATKSAASKVDTYLSDIDPILRSRAIAIINQELRKLRPVQGQPPNVVVPDGDGEVEKGFPVDAVVAAQQEEIRRQAASLDEVDAAEQALRAREGHEPEDEV